MKNLLQLLLLTLLLVIIIFFYKSYFSENKVVKKIEEITPKENIEIKNNLITNLKYNVELLDDGKYEITAESSEITFEDGAEIVIMEKVIAIFTDKKNRKTYITSDYAKFNSANYNTFFEKNIKIRNAENIITSNKLDFNFNKDDITIYDNVVYNGLNGVVETENIKINLITKNVEIFMNNPKKKVKVTTK